MANAAAGAATMGQVSFTLSFISLFPLPYQLPSTAESRRHFVHAEFIYAKIENFNRSFLCSQEEAVTREIQREVIKITLAQRRQRNSLDQCERFSRSGNLEYEQDKNCRE
jgi:hypothetical protein